MVSIQESFELFFDTLSRFDNDKLDLNDDELAWHIFEELDSEYHSFLHPITVDRLVNEKLIPEYLRGRILGLRENIFPVMESKHEIELYRNDPDWIQLRNEANSIKNEIVEYQKT
ncbi:MAG: hypothetical protein ACFHU9_01365 [Fluviicola sp.]